uniref:Uncharacterized protein n=1 Tax=Cyprinodon variegatus TaxID=28743 RepID=A0A3Q2CKB9_CYPVA
MGGAPPPFPHNRCRSTDPQQPVSVLFCFNKHFKLSYWLSHLEYWVYLSRLTVIYLYIVTFQERYVYLFCIISSYTVATDLNLPRKHFTISTAAHTHT